MRKIWRSLTAPAANPRIQQSVATAPLILRPHRITYDLLKDDLHMPLSLPSSEQLALKQWLLLNLLLKQWNTARVEVPRYDDASPVQSIMELNLYRDPMCPLAVQKTFAFWQARQSAINSGQLAEARRLGQDWRKQASISFRYPVMLDREVRFRTRISVQFSPTSLGSGDWINNERGMPVGIRRLAIAGFGEPQLERPSRKAL